jgi:hypothetical protein
MFSDERHVRYVRYRTYIPEDTNFIVDLNILVCHLELIWTKWLLRQLCYDGSRSDRMQCQMSVSKKLTCKGTLQQVFYLTEASAPISHPPLHTVCVFSVYLFTQGSGEGGRES